MLYQLTADQRRLVIRMRFAQPDERGIGIAIDDGMPLRLDQLPCAPHDLVTAQGDGRGQARIEETAATGTEHAVEGIHDDFQRLRQRLVVLAFRRFAPLPDALHDCRQTVPSPREARTAEAGNRLFVIRLAQPVDQPHRVDEKGSYDRRIEALVIEHQY